MLHILPYKLLQIRLPSTVGCVGMDVGNVLLYIHDITYHILLYTYCIMPYVMPYILTYILFQVRFPSAAGFVGVDVRNQGCCSSTWRACMTGCQVCLYICVGVDCYVDVYGSQGVKGHLLK